MTLTAEPIAGSTRVVVLSSEPGVARGGAAEFRRFGLSIVLREDILAALTEVVHDATAMLIVSADIPCQELRDVLDLAVATCGSSVLLGLTATTDAAAISCRLTRRCPRDRRPAPQPGTIGQDAEGTPDSERSRRAHPDRTSHR